MKACPICDKSSRMVGGYSNKVRATKYNPTGKTRKYPNLQWAALPAGGRLKICTRCLKAGKHLQVAKVK
jgi:ribosomal protein L28